MAEPNCPDWCALLQAALTAHSELLTGKTVVEFRDQNGEMVKYQAAKAGDLASYIETLRRLCNPQYGRYARPRAIGFIF